MNYEQIALANDITEPVNGSWVQAICESLGIMQSVNGSWTQALAQYGPFSPPLEPLINGTTLTDFFIYNYQAGAGPKGTDIYEFEFNINYNTLYNDPNILILIKENENGFKIVLPSINTLNGSFTISTIVDQYYEDGLTPFYYEAFYTNSPNTITYTTQIINISTGQLSPVNTHTITLTPP